MKKYEVTTKVEGKELGISQKNIDIYIKYLHSCAIKSKETVNTTYKTYFDNMKLFFQYLKDHEGNRYILSVDTQKNFTDIWERYCSFCMMRGNNKRTIANKRTAISTFFDWCLKRRLIKVNPFIYIEKLKITASDKVRESYFLTTKQIWEINYTMKIDSKHFDIQDRLLFNLFLDSGARISEIHGLKLEQLDIEEMLFHEVRHKEGYIEPVIFFEDTKFLIKEWLQQRVFEGIESEYLFVTTYNRKVNQMSKETIRSRVRKIGKIVGIDNFYPHSIRKSILNITGQQNENVAAALGHHKNIDVTREHYMKKKKLTEMRNALLQIRNLTGL